ncbi:MAG: hypothetical protein INQ03_06870 [Candidatus Heimdallarchaeota archaeon]|nr:hypothetical protein [Candidatus Heimdallarchaeota archaeon]
MQAPPPTGKHVLHNLTVETSRIPRIITSFFSLQAIVADALILFDPWNSTIINN